MTEIIIKKKNIKNDLHKKLMHIFRNKNIYTYTYHVFFNNNFVKPNSYVIKIVNAQIYII